MTIATGDDRWLIGIDIDGTLVTDDGFLAERVVEEVATRSRAWVTKLLLPPVEAQRMHIR